MRLPSLFRLPRHQQFRIQPRHYDPVKEEIHERTEKIKKEMEGMKSGEYLPTKITFKRKTSPMRTASMMQFFIAALLGGLLLGWLEYGNGIFKFYLMLFSGGYLVYRWIKRKKKNE